LEPEELKPDGHEPPILEISLPLDCAMAICGIVAKAAAAVRARIVVRIVVSLVDLEFLWTNADGSAIREHHFEANQALSGIGCIKLAIELAAAILEAAFEIAGKEANAGFAALLHLYALIIAAMQFHRAGAQIAGRCAIPVVKLYCAAAGIVGLYALPFEAIALYIAGPAIDKAGAPLFRKTLLEGVIAQATNGHFFERDARAFGEIGERFGWRAQSSTA